MQNPEPHVCKAEIASRARTEALAMTCADPGHAHGRAGELAAAALRAHGMLSAGLGRSVPVTGLGPSGGGVRGLATFLAVYAAQQAQAQAQAQVQAQVQVRVRVQQEVRDLGAAV